jgi:hypothetical protein
MVMYMSVVKHLSSESLKPTIKISTELQKAFDHFNSELFGGELPDCILTFDNYNMTTLGYFSPQRYVSVNGEIKDGISMNAQYFHDRDIEDTLSTMVHELCHGWQEHFGKRKSLHAYHKALK